MTVSVAESCCYAVTCLGYIEPGKSLKLDNDRGHEIYLLLTQKGFSSILEEP